MDSMKLGAPDADSVKLFVGQIPREATEEILRQTFEEFGPVHSVIVLKDRATQENKGCCFLQYFKRNAAMEAMNALHGKITMSGMKHPLQVKPANSEIKSEEERRLFVGMMARSMTQQDLVEMFEPFGALEDCVILVDSEGNSKGCSFVTFATRQCAVNAIVALHHSKTMEGCRSPLVVKFADTQAQKDQKHKQVVNSPSLQQSGFTSASLHSRNGGGSNAQFMSNMFQHQQAPMSFSHGGNSGFPYSGGPNFGGGGQNFGGIPNFSNGSNFNSQLQSFNANNNGTGSGYGSMSYPPPGVPNAQYPPPGAPPTDVFNNAPNLQSIQALAQLATNPVLSALLNPAIVQQFASAAAALGAPMNNSPAQGGMYGGGGASYGGGGASYGGGGASYGGGGASYGGVGSTNGQSMNYSGQMRGSTLSKSSGKHNEGPEGCNLFIYHIPTNYSDNDLHQLFSAFGNVISSKVFIDKVTNMSKGYGFVSYDNKVSANNAIKSMNGFCLGTGKLKVQLKTPKSGKPY